MKEKDEVAYRQQAQGHCPDEFGDGDGAGHVELVCL